MRITALNSVELMEALPQLTALLRDAVDSGASVGFLPPLSAGDAEEYWRSTRAGIDAGSRHLFCVLAGDRIAGSVQLDFATKANALHRAEVMKLMVHRDFRKRGYGRLLMREAERAAAAAGRRLLVLDTRAGDPSEHLYESLGYVRGGMIPGYARSASGELHDTVFLYRRLD